MSDVDPQHEPRPIPLRPDDVAPQRFPRFVYEGGSEPDPRFSLANERTFLAWVRTALALVAAGVALEAVAAPITPGLRMAVALLFVAMGVAAAVQGWVGWARTERALRRGQVLRGPSFGALLAVGLVLAAVLLVVGLLL